MRGWDGWSDDKVSTLRQMFSDGYTFGQIAVALECPSRNAVIGKVHRLGLPPRRAGASGSEASAQRAARAPRPVRPAAPAEPAAKPKLSGKAPSLIVCDEIETLAPVGGVHLMDLEPRHCRWPLWGAGRPNLDILRFCGGPTPEDSVYCRAHTRLGTVEPTPSQRRAVRDARAAVKRWG